MRLFQNKKPSTPSASEIVCQELRSRFQLNIPLNIQPLYWRLFLIEKNKKSDLSNKQMIYMGNAIIRTVTTEWVFEEYPYSDEGDLTELRVLLCNQNQIKIFEKKLQLSSIAQKLTSSTSIKHFMEGKLIKLLMSRLFLDFGYNPSQVFYIQHVLNAFVDKSKLEKSMPPHKASGFGFVAPHFI
ncbi:MAG: ribonuclease III domain-containing protein [Flavobacteriaceae bacterium]|nr:ribonuclease III domain-containing protein [Flavobacteriaceae bacterium]MCY4267451.1 ribonuclease III domain-containing protein [Flavobacteriaceae bacterium]MCY4299135.1 ribonuclease III domain-containing protein [Flavobacteriaceae bacterium]